MQAERILSMLALLISIVALVLSLVLKERFGEVDEPCSCPTYGETECDKNKKCNCEGVGWGYGVCQN